MRVALRWLICAFAALALGALLAACGSGGAPGDDQAQPVSTETPRSERVEREASIMQQQQQAPEASGETEEASADTTEEEDEIPASSAAMVEQVGEIDFGHRKGLPFNRNVVGDPDAPVVIVEYSDFQ